MKYRAVINYLNDISKRHKDVLYVAHGNFDKIIGAQRSKIKYPCVWIESPSSVLVGDADAANRVHQCAFVVLLNSEVDNTERVEKNIDKSEDICIDLISKIIEDWQNDILNTVNIDINSFNMDIVWSDISDNDQGWRVQFSLVTKSSIICDTSQKFN